MDCTKMCIVVDPSMKHSIILCEQFIQIEINYINMSENYLA
jgi:hypothetical protein